MCLHVPVPELEPVPVPVPQYVYTRYLSEMAMQMRSIFDWFVYAMILILSGETV